MEFRRGRADAVEGGERSICRRSTRPGVEDGGEGGVAFGGVADGEEECGAGGVEGFGGLDADARGAAGDEDDFVRELALKTFVLDDVEGRGAGVRRRAVEMLVGGGVARGHGCFG